MSGYLTANGVQPGAARSAYDQLLAAGAANRDVLIDQLHGHTILVVMPDVVGGRRPA